MGDSADDPFLWDEERVIQEFCTPDRSWDVPDSKLPDPVTFASKLREAGIDGESLLTFEDLSGSSNLDSLLRDQLEVKRIPHRLSIQKAVRLFKSRSAAYRDWKKRHLKEEMGEADAGSDGAHEEENTPESRNTSLPSAPGIEIAVTGLPHNGSHSPVTATAPVQQGNPDFANPLPIAVDESPVDIAGQGLPNKELPDVTVEDQLAGIHEMDIDSSQTTAAKPIDDGTGEPPKKKKRVSVTTVSTAPTMAAFAPIPTEADVLTRGSEVVSGTWGKWLHSSDSMAGYLGQDGLLPGEIVEAPSETMMDDDDRQLNFVQPSRVPSGRRIQVNRAMKRRFLRDRDVEDDDDALEDSDDKVLPIFGESDDDEIDTEFEKELEQEAEETELAKARQNRHLPDEVVKAVVEGIIAQYDARWIEIKKPRLERKGFRIWNEARRNGSRGTQLKTAMQLCDNIDRRLKELVGAICAEKWLNKTDVERQSVCLEGSVSDKAYNSWLVNLLRNPSPPRPPKQLPMLKPLVKEKAVRFEEDEEILSSDPSDIDDFIVDDEVGVENGGILDNVEESPLGIDMDVDDDQPSSEEDLPIIQDDTMTNDDDRVASLDVDVAIDDDQSSEEELPIHGQHLVPDKGKAKALGIDGQESELSEPMDVDSDDIAAAVDAEEAEPDQTNVSNAADQDVSFTEDEDDGAASDGKAVERAGLKLSPETPTTTRTQTKLSISPLDPVKRKLFSTTTPKGKTPKPGNLAVRTPTGTQAKPIMLDSPSPSPSANPDKSGIPSLDDIEAISQTPAEQWAKRKDRERMLLSILAKWSPGTTRNILQVVASHQDDILWNLIVTRVLDKKEPRSSTDSNEAVVASVARGLVLLADAFITYTTSRAFSKAVIKDRTLERVRNGKEEFEELCKFLRNVKDLFPTDSQPSIQIDLNKKPTSDDSAGQVDSPGQTPDSDADGVVDNAPHDSSSTDMPRSSARRKKPRRAVVQDVEAANLRISAEQQKKEFDRRRQLLREKLAQSDVSDDKTRLIINEAKDSDAALIYVNDNIAGRIKEHQIEGVRFMWNQIVASETRQGCLLAHTMGLGKTMQVITLLVAIAEAGSSPDPSVHRQIPKDLRKSRTLVLCPAGLVNNWIDEFLIWAPDQVLGNLELVDSTTKASERTGTIERWEEDGGVLVMGYNLFSKLSRDDDLREILLHAPNIVVGDEAHYLKNAKSQVHRATENFRTTSRIAMTGSPLTNNVIDYYAMINWVAPGFLSRVDEFRSLYANPIKEGLYADSAPYEKRRALLRLSALKTTVAPKVHRMGISALKHQMPNKREFIISVPLTATQRKAYEAYIQQMINNPKVGDQMKTQAKIWSFVGILSTLLAHPFVFLNRLKARRDEQKKQAQKLGEDAEDVQIPDDLISQFMALVSQRKASTDYDASNKLTLLMHILDESKKVGDKVLVFSQSIPTLDYLEDIFKRQKRVFFRLDGSTPVASRQAQIKRFNDNTNAEVYLISTKAGGVGLNIYGANRVVIFDFKYVPSDEQQAVGRAYRIGQTKEVFVYWLVCGGTFESVIQNKSVFKMQLASRVVDKKNPVAWSKRLGDYFAVPVDPKQTDLSRTIGQDVVLDGLLKNQGLRGIIREVTSTDTFEEEDVDTLKLTLEETNEVNSLIQKRHPLQSNSSMVPQAYADAQAGPGVKIMVPEHMRTKPSPVLTSSAIPLPAYAHAPAGNPVQYAPPPHPQGQQFGPRYSGSSSMIPGPQIGVHSAGPSTVLPEPPLGTAPQMLPPSVVTSPSAARLTPIQMPSSYEDHGQVSGLPPPPQPLASSAGNALGPATILPPRTDPGKKSLTAAQSSIEEKVGQLRDALGPIFDKLQAARRPSAWDPNTAVDQLTKDLDTREMATLPRMDYLQQLSKTVRESERFAAAILLGYFKFSHLAELAPQQLRGAAGKLDSMTEDEFLQEMSSGRPRDPQPQQSLPPLRNPRPQPQPQPTRQLPWNVNGSSSKPTQATLGRSASKSKSPKKHRKVKKERLPAWAYDEVRRSSAKSSRPSSTPGPPRPGDSADTPQIID